MNFIDEELAPHSVSTLVLFVCDKDYNYQFESYPHLGDSSPNPFIGLDAFFFRPEPVRGIIVINRYIRTTVAGALHAMPLLKTGI